MDSLAGSLPDIEAVNKAIGKNGIDSHLPHIGSPFRQLRLQRGIEFLANRVCGVGNVAAFCLS
jgi:hypothetical protein